MASNVVFYNLLLMVLCLYAARRGGQPEQLAVFGWAAASIATLALPFDPLDTFHRVNPAEVAIDVAVLLWFVGIAVTANRFWPIWLAALQLLGVAVHGVKAYEPELLPSIYAVALGKIAYPILAVMAAGVWRHRVRLARVGSYRDWSTGGRA